MLTGRVEREIVDRIDFVVACRGGRERGWTRTTWLLRAIGGQLAADEELFEVEIERALASDSHARAEAVARVRRWRAARRLRGEGEAS